MRARRLAVFVTLLAAPLLVAGFRLLPTKPTLSQRQQMLAADLDRLRGDDGFYLGGLASQPGLFDSAYGLAALAASGKGVRPTVSEADFASQITADPLWSRRYLAMLEATTHQPLHGPTDVTAVLATRTSEGYFADPVADPRQATDPGYRLASTDAALETLADFGIRLPPADRHRTADWLDIVGAHAATSSLTQRLHLERARAALGLPASDDLRAAMRDWWTRTGSTHRGVLHGDDFLETCSYIELATATGTDLAAQRTQLEVNLDPAAPPSDPQAADALAQAWSALRAEPGALEPLRRHIARHQLPSGLISSVQIQLGDLQASQQVEILRSLAGLPTRDPRLASALRAHRGDLDRSSPGATATWLSVMAAAGATNAAADPTLRARALADLPSTLSADTAQTWSGMIAALASLHLTVPPVHVVPWAADTPGHRYARYLAITGLARTGRLAALPWPESPGRVAGQGIDLLSVGSLHQAEAALTAATALGWHPTHTDHDRLLALLRPLQGCPGTPALFRDNPASKACNIYSTTSAWRILQMLTEVNQQRRRPAATPT